MSLRFFVLFGMEACIIGIPRRTSVLIMCCEIEGSVSFSVSEASPQTF